MQHSFHFGAYTFVLVNYDPGCAGVLYEAPELKRVDTRIILQAV